MRDMVEKLLAERGIDDAATFVDSLPDLDGAVATVAYFDDYRGRKSKGLLVSLLRSGRENGYRRPEVTPSASDRGAALEDEMRTMGFEERLVPFAASAVSVRGPASKERIEGHLRASQPWLFGDAA